MKPLISIIVPVYKVENLLPKCIESILAQTYDNLEVILVDDGSPDLCGKICDEYAKRDNRIKVIHQENAGLAGARNAGLDIANGEYFGFVDSDDHISPDMYEILLNSIMREEADIAICGRYMELENGELIPMFDYKEQKVFNNQEAVRRFLLSDGLDVAAWDKLYKKELWGDMRYPLYYVSEDVPVTSRLLAKAKKIVHCGKPLYYYLQRAGSLSHSVFNSKSWGLYYFYKEVGLEMAERFPNLKEEGYYYYYKALLVLLFRYAGSDVKDQNVKEAYEQVKKNILHICMNRYLKVKYKIFAAGLCIGLDRIAVKISDKTGINDNSLTK